MRHGEFTHIEIPADDLPRAKRFYGDLFGWQFEDVPGYEGYTLFVTASGPDGTGGAIGTRGEQAPDRVRNYVHVDSIDDLLPRLTELGGRLLDAKSEVPDMGWYAVVADTEGNEFALWESAPGR